MIDIKKLPGILALLLFSLGVEAGIFEPGALKVYIKLDKKNFYTDERIMLKIRVHNSSPEKVFFMAYDTMDGNTQDYATFQPVVFDMSGREADSKVTHRLEGLPREKVMGSLSQRMVELAPGETIEHRIDVKSLYELQTDRSYRIRAFFFPDYEKGMVVKSGNELVFRITEEKHSNKVVPLKQDRPGLTPRETIVLLLNAERHRDWPRFMKYVYIEKYIQVYPDFVRAYRLASFEDKVKIEDRFMNYLARERDDYLMKYKILREDIEDDKQIAYVEVMVDRYGIKRTNRYRYRYTLQRFKDSWLIVDLDAAIQKGSKR